MRILTVLVVGLMAAIAPAGAMAQSIDGVCKHIPDEAGFVMVVPNLDTLLKGVNGFVKAIGVDSDGELSADDMLDNSPGGAEYYDTGAPFAIAMLAEEQEVVVIATLKDPKKWLSETETTEAEGGLLSIDTGWEEFFVKLDGNTIVFGASEESVGAAVKSTGKFAASFKKHAGKMVADSQALIYIDVTQWQDTVDQTWGMVQMMAPMMAMQMGGGQMPPGAMEGVQFALEKIREFISSVETAVIGGQIGPDGLHLKFVNRLDPEANLPKYFAKISPVDADLLRGLPNAAAPLVFGCEWKEPPQTESLLDQLIARLPSADASAEGEPDQQALQAAALKKSLKQASAMMKKTTGISGLMASNAEGKLGFVGYYLGEDGPALMKDVEGLYDPETAKAFGAKEVTQGKEEIAGQSLSLYSYTLDANDPMKAKANAAMFGESMDVLFATTKQGVLFASGYGELARKLAGAALKPDGDSLAAAPSVQAIMKGLPPKPQFCLLVDPLELMKFAMTMAAAMGNPVPPADMGDTKSAYAGMTGYFTKEEIRLELKVPTKAVAPAVEFGKKMEEAMSAGTAEDDDEGYEDDDFGEDEEHEGHEDEAPE